MDQTLSNSLNRRMSTGYVEEDNGFCSRMADILPDAQKHETKSFRQAALWLTQWWCVAALVSGAQLGTEGAGRIYICYRKDEIIHGLS